MNSVFIFHETSSFHFSGRSSRHRGGSPFESPTTSATTRREASPTISTTTSTSSTTTPSPRRSTRHLAEDASSFNPEMSSYPPSIPSVSPTNTLTVPPVSYGAIPRTTTRAIPMTDQGESKRCFCGYYQEVKQLNQIHTFQISGCNSVMTHMGGGGTEGYSFQNVHQLRANDCQNCGLWVI